MGPRGKAIPTPVRGPDPSRMDMRPQGPVQAALAGDPPIDPELRIGHVHLRTADIDRVRAFYVGDHGLRRRLRGCATCPGWGTTGDILFLSAGGYHHHLGFNTWKSKGGAPQPDGVTGPAPRRARTSPRGERLAEVVRRLIDAGVELRQLADHGTHLAVYVSDPDGNDLELAWDRPFAEWPRLGEDPADLDRPLALEDLFRTRGKPRPGTSADELLDLGRVQQLRQLLEFWVVLAIAQHNSTLA